jgi:hypothetical protein
MPLLIALAALSLLTAAAPDAPSDDAPPPASGQAAPSIDSILTQEPPTEDAREAAVRGAFAEAEALRGGLDGRWRLSGADGAPLYIFQFADSGYSADPRSATPWTPTIEGAWRDLQREGAIDSSGFVTAIERTGGAVVIRFYNRDPSHPQVVTLTQGSGGDWTGALDADGARRNVVMNRF